MGRWLRLRQLLACRAKCLKNLYPNWQILVVCYNISLSRYLGKLLELSGPEVGKFCYV